MLLRPLPNELEIPALPLRLEDSGVCFSCCVPSERHYAYVAVALDYLPEVLETVRWIEEVRRVLGRWDRREGRGRGEREKGRGGGREGILLV